MVIKFDCTRCDKKLGVPDEYAGKRVRCPRCKHPVTVPELEIESVEEPTPDSLGSEDRFESDYSPDLKPPQFDFPSRPDDQTTPPTAEETPAPEKSAAPRCSKCLTVIPDGSEFCITCGHPAPLPAPAEEKEEPKKSGLLRSVPMGKGFVTDLISMISPVKSGSDAIVFVTLLIFHVLVFLPIVRIFWFFIYGAICAYMFDLLLETANGDDHLPKFEMPDSLWQALKPYLQIIVSFLYTFLPFTICLIAVSASSSSETEKPDWVYNESTETSEGQEYDRYPAGTEEQSGDPDTYDRNNEQYPANEKSHDQDNSANRSHLYLLIVFLVAGIFFWPMIVLTIVLGDTFLPNPIKVIQNIGRTLKPYLICCIMIYLTSILIWLSIAKFSIEGLSVEGNYIPYLIFTSVLIGSLSIEIYSMRALGLLYRHYEERLDW